MAQIVKELRVDVSQPNVFQAIVAKQLDSNSRFLKITLVDFGVKVEVPNTAKVTINANRPDGASESFKGEANNDGTITVPLAQWMLDIDGEVKCDVSVINTEDNKRLTSTDFWLEVQKAANPNASIPLDPDGEILIIKPVTEINGNSKDTDYPSAKAVYDYGQNIVTDTQITATATGSAITIESANAPLQNLKLYGKTEQNGTPTPTEPKELKSVGDSGSFEVGVYGKNKLKGIHNSVKNNYETLVIIGNRVFIPKGTNVTVSVYVSATSATKVYWNNTSKITDYKEVSIPSGKTRITYSFVASADIDTKGEKLPLLSKMPTSDGIMITPQKSQIEFNSVATDYEPIINEPLSIPYTLRSVPNATNSGEALGVGETSDIVDFNKGTKTENIFKVTLDGTESIREHANGMLYVQLYGDKTNYKFRAGCGICDQLTNAFSNEATGNVFHIGTEGVYIGKNDSFSTVDELKAYLTTNPMTFYITLQTPIETLISETELNAYRQLMTNKGTTTFLNSDGADMEISYYINKPNAQSIGNIHTQVNKDYFKLQQAIITTGGSTL